MHAALCALQCLLPELSLLLASCSVLLPALQPCRQHQYRAADAAKPGDPERLELPQVREDISHGSPK